jgi:predicted lactoylglutathione lyase
MLIDISSYSSFVKANIAEETNDPDLLEFLSKDVDRYVRRWVAKNPNTPTKVLERLANDEDSVIRYWVAENHNTPQYILTYFKVKEFLNSYE